MTKYKNISIRIPAHTTNNGKIIGLYFNFPTKFHIEKTKLPSSTRYILDLAILGFGIYINIVRGLDAT